MLRYVQQLVAIWAVNQNNDLKDTDMRIVKQRGTAKLGDNLVCHYERPLSFTHSDLIHCSYEKMTSAALTN